MHTISKRKTPQLKLIDFDFMRPDGATADAVLGTDGCARRAAGGAERAVHMCADR